jgi:hypothetical protein
MFASMHLLAQKESTSPKEKKGNGLPESFLNLDLNYASISNISVYQDITSSPFVLKAMIGSKNSGLIIGFQSCTFAYEQELLPGGEVTQDDLRTYWGDNGGYSNIQSAGGNSSLVGDSSNDYNLNGLSMRLGYQQSIFKGLYANISADLTRIKTDVKYINTGVYYDWTPEFGGSVIPEIISYMETTRPDRTILGWRLNTGIGYTFSFGKAKKIYLNTEMVYSVINKSKTIEGNMSLMAGLGFRFGAPAKTTFDNGTKTLRGGRTMP